MPAISKIRFTNVIYENGQKRYNDDIFQFDGHNGAILLENGGGKTVFVQTAIQAVLPHAEVADRKIKNTLMLENSATHIAIEWILNEKPRRYAVTAVTLFINKGSVDSYKYVYEYDEEDDNSIEKLPFVKDSTNGKKRPATKEEIWEYYSDMSQNRMNAKTFGAIKEYNEYIENTFKIIPSEWRKIALINGAEGDVEAFFDACKTNGQLVDNLLIPVVEEALAGNGTKEFIETFEKQREHFKKHKQLRSRIDESKQVENQINLYVKVFENFDEANQKLVTAKENTKAIYRFVEKEAEDNTQRLIKIEEVQEGLVVEEKHWEQKEASYKLALLKGKLNEAEKYFQEASNNYNEVFNTYEEKQKRYENLQVAKYKQDIKDQQQKIKHLEEQINKLNEDEDLEDINDRLKQNSGELRGYYLDQEQKLTKEKFIVEGQIKTSEEEFKSYEKELNKINSQESELSKRISGLEAAIKYLNSDMEKIAGEILDNSAQEKIEEQLIKWQNRINQLDNSIFTCMQQMKKLDEEESDLDEYVPRCRKELSRLKIEETKLDENLKNMQKEQDVLINRLKEIGNNWSNIDSLYLKEATILQQLELRVELLREEKENLIFKERLAHRFLDDYKVSEFYTADSAIERYIKKWRNGFNFIESGTQYVQRVAKSTGKSEKELNESYPYWAASIIVSDSEVDKLTDKIKKYVDEISQPVIIITEKEARNRIDGGAIVGERSIFPSLWEKNLSQDIFESWKSEIEIKANEVSENRKKMEVDFNQCNEVLKHIREFYEKYPYGEYIEFQKLQKTLVDQIDIITKDIETKESRIRQIDQEEKKQQQSLLDFQNEDGILGNRIIRAKEYNNKKVSKEKNEAEKSKVEEKLKLNKEERAKWENRIVLVKRVIEDIGSGLDEINNSLLLLRAEELYEEVKGALPKYTSSSKTVLVDQRKDLKAVLDKKQRGREALEDRLQGAKDNEKKSKDELDKFRKIIEFSVDEELDFPLYGEEEINRLLEDLKKIKKFLKDLESKLDNYKRKYEREQNTYNLREEDFYKQYKEIVIFDEALEQAASRLAQEKEDIEKRNNYNFNRKEQLIGAKKDIEDATNLLKIGNGRFSYLSESIEEIELSEDVKQEIPYKRKEAVSKLISELEVMLKTLENQREKVEEQQSLFIKFCEVEIIDVRLKDMAVTGVQYKKTFKDIIEWQKKMNERISLIIEIAENDIREHDKEVQQFINHLHSYLVTMAQELRMIPRKTRIKVEDVWKEVFLFTVPEWDEKEGKEELGKHMDWMLMQLEGDQFKDDSGAEINEQVRKAVEKWLQSKQLLQIVMKQNNIKIKCRKVTNDGKVNSTPFSWEQSNAWSGGEKWSKNMTLFLGILNYLAEKRTQIVSTHKLHRTVIVDNPFGKASSDHVLDPVFFIAEQLGFQIIALTAHAEGKFVRTYFPIVYSCRLRDASNGSSQIVTKEREIRKAFFRDSDPQALVRLGQLQQMGMFEYQKLK